LSLLDDLSRYTILQCCSDRNQDVLSQAVMMTNAWADSTLQLTALCEGYLRILAAATAQGATPGSEQLPLEGAWAAMTISHWCCAFWVWRGP
jgi:hypothetical protein